MAIGMWTRRIAAFAAGSTVLTARNPVTMRTIISSAVNQCIVTIMAP
jgi:hypothetical protein